MTTLRAHVRQGHLVVDERSDLPEGAEVALVPAPREERDTAERARDARREESDLGEETLLRGDIPEGIELLAELGRRLTRR